MSNGQKSNLEPELDSKLAILIDADNTPHNSIKQILDACTRFGRTIIKRAYGDWTTTHLQNWNDVFRDYAIKPMQQFRYTTGKNVTDTALIIDAMDILHQRRVDTFILVSSDSDFTGLATRIREEGLTVIGIGRVATTPSSFKKACDEFLLIENLSGATIDIETKGKTPSGPKVQAKDAATIDRDSRDAGRDLLVRALQQAADENGLVKGAKLGIILKRLDPTFTPANYGVRKLSDFIDYYPDLVVLVGKREATDPTYRIVSARKW